MPIVLVDDRMRASLRSSQPGVTLPAQWGAAVNPFGGNATERVFPDIPD